MKPDRPGVWEWFEEDGTKRLMSVFNVEPDPSYPLHLRVYWWGGYYNVADSPVVIPDDPFCKAEWPDRWGNFVGENGSVKEEDLYNGPTPEQRKAIMEKYEN